MYKLIVALCNFANAPKIVLKEIFDKRVGALWDLECAGPMAHINCGFRGFEAQLLNRGNQNCMQCVTP